MSNNSTFHHPSRVISRPAEVGDWQIFMAANAYAMSVLSPALNFLVIFVLSRTKELRTPTNTFIGCFAIGEILHSTFSLPFTASSLLKNGWPYSTSACKCSVFMQVLGRTTSSYCLVFVCLDRYIAVSKPLKYTHLITFTYSIVSVILILSCSLFFSVLLLVVWDIYRYVEILFLCTVDPSIDNTGNLVKEVICCYIPTVLTIACLLLVTKEVTSHHRIFAIVPVPDMTNVPVDSNRIITSFLQFPRSVSIGGFNRNTRRALWSFFIMALSYVIFCLPSAVSSVLQINAKNKTRHPSPMTLIPAWLSILYSFVNPVIMIVFNRKFRSQLKIIGNKWRRGNKVQPIQEVFTISSGLQSILDTTLIKSLGLCQTAKTGGSFPVHVRRVGVVNFSNYHTT